MAGASSKLQILIEAKTAAASGPIKSLEGDLKGLDKAASGISGGLAGLAGAAGIAGIAALGTAAAGAVVEMARGAAETERLATAFDSLAAQAGQSGDAMLAAMQEAAQGTISNAELMGDANRAMLLGVADSADEMAQLMDVAAARGKAMGETTAQAFNDIIVGIGRLSGPILDNLGITIDAEKAYANYAQQLGVTSESLTDAQKKQAFLNDVIKSSTQIVKDNKDAGSDAASNYERMDAALTNAKDALGELFSPAIAAIAQSIADATNTAVAGMKEMAKPDNNIAKALDPDLLQIELLKEQIDDLRTSMQELAKDGQVGSDAYREQAAELDRLTSKVTGLSTTLAIESNAAGAADEHTRGLTASLALSAEAQKVLAAAALEAAKGMGSGLLSADALSAKLKELKAQSDATSAALAGIASSAIGALHSAASAAVGLLPTTEIAKIYGENTKKIAEQVKVMHEVGMSQDEIDFKTQELAKKASLPFDIAVEAAREAEKANNHVASSVDALSKEYNDLEGKVSSVLQAALDPGVGVDPQKILEGMGFPREDAINENARRLADIAANGLKGQDWMGEFQKEVPDIWQMLRLAQNPQEEAARLLQDFQDGLLTSPIDKAKAKEIIRRQITGDQNMAELTSQIAQELASEMGIPLQQALAAAQGTLGGSSGAGTEAAVSFGDAALAQVEGANTGSAVVTTVITQMKSQYPLLATAGGEAAKQWGDAFIAKVGENVPPQLINILTNLITPQVIAQLGQRGSLTGAVS